MPIKKGNTTIGAIYKGTTQIAKVYKGTKLLFENAVWLDYYFSNLYHDLVPETIDSKSVKNKAKVSVIEANGEIVNQNIPDNIASVTVYGYTAQITDGVISITKNAAGDWGNMLDTDYYLIAGHKYLYYDNAPSYAKIKLSTQGSPSLLNSGTITTITTTSSRGAFIRIDSETDSTGWTAGTTIRFGANLIDLTQMFGTGNEPTTLTDNRIQALLNRGYIPYNTGTYKGTDIGLFSSEAYNLFDGEWEVGGFSSSGSLTSNTTNCRSVNYISVIGGATYAFERGSLTTSNTSGRYIEEYDEYFNWLGEQSLGNLSVDLRTVTTKQNTKYIKLCYYIASYNFTGNLPTDSCFHLTNTRTGYAPYQSFTPIAFRYQGNGAINAHDTMTVTKDNVVFGKNVGRKTFGSSESLLDFSADSGNCRFGFNLYGQQSNSGTTTPNILSDGAVVITPAEWYARSKTGFTFGSSGYGGNGRLYAAILGVSSVADAQNWLNGKTVEYELQASDKQTITIPRKHLGVVDLGSLSWIKFEYSGLVMFYANSPRTGNNYAMYSSKYPYIPDGTAAQANMQIRNDTFLGANLIYVIDNSYSDATTFKSAMQGQYLFYETQDEVADILDTLDIEAGGTVNANWFEWVENQIVYDGNFANGTNDWFCLSTVYSQSVTNNVMTVTKNAGGAGLICSKSNSDITYTVGHKFVALAQVKPSRNCSLNFDVSTVQTAQSMTANVWNTLSYFANPSSLTNYYFAIAETTNTLQVNDTVDIKNVMLIDLTQAFGSGNEPTSVNDPRIQYIINKGYIPTNTTGTYKLVDCEVLPNVEFKVKCK